MSAFESALTIYVPEADRLVVQRSTKARPAGTLPLARPPTTTRSATVMSVCARPHRCKFHVRGRCIHRSFGPRPVAVTVTLIGLE